MVPGEKNQGVTCLEGQDGEGSGLLKNWRVGTGDTDVELVDDSRLDL